MIREATEADRDTIIHMVQGLNEDAMRFEPYMPGLTAATAHAQDLLAELAELDGFVLFAEINGLVVGMITGMTQQDDISIEPAQRPIGYVSELFVASEQRGQGIGNALLAEAEQRFRAKGIRRMEISVAERNVDAVRLYERFGFGPHVRLMMKPLD